MYITFSILAAVRWDEPASVFVAFAPQLGLYSQGATEDEAFDAMGSAITMYAQTCMEKGIWHNVIKKRNLKAARHSDPIQTIEDFQRSVERNFGPTAKTREIETGFAFA